MTGSTVWYLREKCQWNGLLLDRGYGSNPNINKKEVTIYKENICQILQESNVPLNFDLLSLDIDGNDYWILTEILKIYKPRVIIVEANVRFAMYDNLVRKYEADWPANSFVKWFGASPYAYKLLGEKYNYSPVYINYDDIFLIQKDDLHENDKNIPWEFIYPKPTPELYIPQGESIKEPYMWITPEI